MLDTYYILDGREGKKVDFLTWARWFGMADRQVVRTEIGKAVVSTVFLGINHRFLDNGPPLLFETMVFGGPFHEEMTRCSTWDEAVKMHEAMCQRIQPQVIAMKKTK